MSLFELDLPPIREDEPRSYVMAATPWANNGELIFDCARLGYLGKERRTLDVTYGEGNWWTVWRPEELITNDIDPEKSADHHYDFRALPWRDGEFDDATYDPPYIAPGGRDSSTVGDFNVS